MSRSEDRLYPCSKCLDGLRTGLLLAVVVIFLLLAANFQSLQALLYCRSTVPAVIAESCLPSGSPATTLNIQSFMGASWPSELQWRMQFFWLLLPNESRLAGASATQQPSMGALESVCVPSS